MTYDRLAIKAAASVYGREPLEDVRFVWSGAVDHIQFDVMHSDSLRATVVAFAGSNELADWVRHLFVRRERLKGFRGLVHRGWLADWRLAQATALAAWNDCGRHSETLIVCGHSYGGALAQLAGVFFSMKVPADQIRLYTYGSPRVGNRGFANTLDSLIPYHYRYTIKGDPVPHLPLGIRYMHAGMHVQLPYRPKPHDIRNYKEALS